MSAKSLRLPTFVLAQDGKYYEDLIYQDIPNRRAWFITFDCEEPAEIVIRESALKAGATPYDILHYRGFDACLAPRPRGIYDGRKELHKRFFGPEDGVAEHQGHDAISWFLRFNKGVPLPIPSRYDSCVEIWPMFPNRIGVYWGTKDNNK